MISGPISKGDHIFGADSDGELRCLELKNGDSEIILNDRGRLILATLSADGYKEHSLAALIKPIDCLLRLIHSNAD